MRFPFGRAFGAQVVLDRAMHEVLVDNVGYDENNWPKKHTDSEVRGALLSEQSPIEGRDTKGVFHGEILDADEFCDQCVTDEKSGESLQQTRGPIMEHGVAG